MTMNVMNVTNIHEIIVEWYTFSTILIKTYFSIGFNRHTIMHIVIIYFLEV